MKKSMDMDLVFKRKNCLSDNKKYDIEKFNMSRTLHKMKIAESVNNERDLMEVVIKTIKNYSSKANATNGYKQCIDLIEEVNNRNEKNSTHCTKLFISEVLPYCENLYDVQNYSFSKNIGDDNRKAIVESVQTYHVCDRINNNHDKLIKRFSINNIFTTGKNTPIDETCRNICEMIDTYDISPHIKMNLCIEELAYLFNKYEINTDHADMVENIVEYFLSIPNKNFDINNYKKIIMSSEILHENADKKVLYLTKDKNEILSENSQLSLDYLTESYGEDKIKELMNQYKLDTEKSDSKFKQILNKIFTQPTKNIVEDTPDILKWIRNFAVLAVSAQSPIAALVTFLVNGYIHFDMRKKESERVIKYFENERDQIESKIDRTNNRENIDRLNSYLNELNKAIKKLNDYNDTLYTQDEIMNREDLDFNFESYIFEESNKVIMNNLINDAMEADKIIEKIIEKDFKNTEVKLTNEKDTVTSESLLRYIDPNGRISFVLCSYDISNNDNISKIYEMADSIIRTVNNRLSKTSCKVYYTLMENYIDFVCRSKFIMITNINEDTMTANSMTDVEIMRVSKIVENAQLMEQLENLHPDTLIDNAIRKIGYITAEQAEIFVTAWTLCESLIDKDDMTRFVNEYCDYQLENEEFIDVRNMKNIFTQPFALRSKDLSDIVEATQFMNDVIMESVDLNTIKLAWMAFKKKIKNMSAKEQEACRDLDSSFNNLVRGVQNFYKVSDHRENIIKGQVGPSLSKIVKIGITLAGLGLASGGIVLPSIAVVSGLALSKNSSDKERQLIIDEIDIELQVVDREIKKVEDAGKSSKKYRTLLTYQKNLQREKQRIVYHLAKKGKPIQMASTAGIKGGND